jgi:hypothetical protein
MQIRLTGTRAECDRFTTELIAATPAGIIREVSGFHPHHGTSLLGRVYLEVDLPAPDDSPTPAPTPARRTTTTAPAPVGRRRRAR